MIRTQVYHNNTCYYISLFSIIMIIIVIDPKQEKLSVQISSSLSWTPASFPFRPVSLVLLTYPDSWAQGRATQRLWVFWCPGEDGAEWGAEEGQQGEECNQSSGQETQSIRLLSGPSVKSLLSVNIRDNSHGKSDTLQLILLRTIQWRNKTVANFREMRWTW